MATPVMSTADQQIQQRRGYTNDETGAYGNNVAYGNNGTGAYANQGTGGYTNQGPGGYVNQTPGSYTNEVPAAATYTNEKGYSGPPGSYPAQSYPAHAYGQYQEQPVDKDHYVDADGKVRKRRTRGTALAVFLGACWCITWPCHGPCCGGL